jgi:hypothetical protein
MYTEDIKEFTSTVSADTKKFVDDVSRNQPVASVVTEKLAAGLSTVKQGLQSFIQSPGEAEPSTGAHYACCFAKLYSKVILMISNLPLEPSSQAKTSFAAYVTNPSLRLPTALPSPVYLHLPGLPTLIKSPKRFTRNQRTQILNNG